MARLQLDALDLEAQLDLRLVMGAAGMFRSGFRWAGNRGVCRPASHMARIALAKVLSRQN